MNHKDLNRIKVVLVEHKRINKWLAEQLGKDPATVSKWCTNSSQPSIDMFFRIAVLENWRFWVVPTSTINRLCEDNKTIPLGRVKRITGLKDDLGYGELREEVDRAIN